MADKMFPGEWQRNKGKFQIRLDSTGDLIFEGLGLCKRVSALSIPHKIDYSIFGRTLPFMYEYSKIHNDCIFVMPSRQKVAGTYLVEAEADISLIGSAAQFFNFSDGKLDLRLRHDLIEHAKRHLTPYILDINKQSLVDPKDLLYQSLFRMMAVNPGNYVKSQLIESDYLGFTYDEVAGDEVQFNERFLKDIVFEQYNLLLNEYYNKERSLYTDLSSRLLSKGKLKVENNQPRLILGDTKVDLEIKEVPENLARRIHGSFHYIHTPRTNGYILGLYIKGEQLPLSVIAVEKVDRMYKKAALAHFDLSHRHVYELTRMYSCNNSPQNTSSFMLAATNSFLKSNDRYWEASISSFMPSYAGGLSMISGGFKDALYLKSCKHYYENTGGSGIAVLTKRRIQTAANVITNRTKLMPVIELIHARKPIDQSRILTLKEEKR